MALIIFLIYLAAVSVLVTFVATATMDRYRHLFPWLVTDHPDERQ